MSRFYSFIDSFMLPIYHTPLLSSKHKKQKYNNPQKKLPGKYWYLGAIKQTIIGSFKKIAHVILQEK